MSELHTKYEATSSSCSANMKWFQEVSVPDKHSHTGNCKFPFLMFIKYFSDKSSVQAPVGESSRISPIQVDIFRTEIFVFFQFDVRLMWGTSRRPLACCRFWGHFLAMSRNGHLGSLDSLLGSWQGNVWCSVRVWKQLNEPQRCWYPDLFAVVACSCFLLVNCAVLKGAASWLSLSTVLMKTLQLLMLFSLFGWFIFT